MLKNWALMIYSCQTGKLFIEEFTEPTAAEAKHDFWECYRNGRYHILAVVEKPERQEE